ncbi:MAG: hypothetical protein BWY67_01669 [Bacteroidetes bacterium ADurb.Bin397]|nr:MAG: hypothetical protein BWY67_01669 [Bacteroidetes bacterium ADurb.Bin397]
MRAVGKTDFQKAVAIATSTSFGVGDSGFHDESKEGFTESVYLGAWKRNVFEATGLFDTDMLRNQDDEFHYRARANGMRIYLDPKIKSWYAPRSTMKTLWKQYYQYGLFKPLVLKKVSSGIRLRHLIPAGFVCYLLLSLLSFWYPALLIPAVLYLLLDLFYSFRYGSSFAVSSKMLLVYPMLHCSYGLGFIKGFFILLTGKKPTL